MAKERAVRRAERERQAAAAAAARARAARRRRWIPRPRPRRPRPEGLLARRRRAQNRVIALLVIVAQFFGWVAFHSVRTSVALGILTAFAVPVLVTLALDRRG